MHNEAISCLLSSLLVFSYLLNSYRNYFLCKDKAPNSLSIAYIVSLLFYQISGIVIIEELIENIHVIIFCIYFYSMNTSSLLVMTFDVYSDLKNIRSSNTIAHKCKIFRNVTSCIILSILIPLLPLVIMTFVIYYRKIDVMAFDLDVPLFLPLYVLLAILRLTVLFLSIMSIYYIIFIKKSNYDIRSVNIGKYFPFVIIVGGITSVYVLCAIINLSFFQLNPNSPVQEFSRFLSYYEGIFVLLSYRYRNEIL